MGKIIPGIQGRPFRKVVSIETTPDIDFVGGWSWKTETLSCGHKVLFRPAEYNKASKRRCYHPACESTPKVRTKHWTLPKTFKAYCGGLFKTGSLTVDNEAVTCQRCIKLMKLHDHIAA